MNFCNSPVCLYNKEKDIVKRDVFQTHYNFRLPPLTSAYIQGTCLNKAWILYQRDIGVDRCGIIFRVFRGPFDTLELGKRFLTPFNLNEYVDKDSCVKICTDPKNITGGIEIDEIIIPGPDNSFGFRQNTKTLEQKTKVLKGNVDYVLQFQHIKTVGDPTTIHVNWTWIEKDESFFK